LSKDYLNFSSFCNSLFAVQVELLAASLNKIINKYFIPHTKQCLSTVQTAQLMLFGYIIAVYFENHRKCLNTLRKMQDVCFKAGIMYQGYTNFSAI
jgi:hypothetical protein